MKNKKYFKTITYKETGLRHIEKGKGCEDHVYTSYSEETGVKVIALSDGAGSYSHAAIGSETASRISAELLSDKFNLIYDLDDETAADFIIKEVRGALEALAEQSGDDLFSYSATLLCTAMHPDGRFIVFHIGDGAVIGYNVKEDCRIVSIYEHDGPANQTTFVTVDHTEYKLVRGRDEYIAFVMMSDGPEDFLVNETDINPRVKMMIQFAYFISEEGMKEQLASLVKLLNDNGMFDDASFAVMINTQKTADVFESLMPEMRNMLFELDSELSSKKIKKTLAVINIISLHPNGVTLKQITRCLHVHSPRIAKKKIDFMIKMKLIERVNGRYYIAG